MKNSNRVSSISFKGLIACFMAAFILSAGVFTISSTFCVNDARAAITNDPMYSHNTEHVSTPAPPSTVASADTSSKKGGGGGSIFTTISSKMWKAVGGLRNIAYVIAGFGLVAFTFGAIFNKISWKHFGNIMISLFILSIMTPLIEWIAYGEGAKNKLTFGYKYVAPGDHASLEAESSCEEAGNCPNEEKNNTQTQNCEETCQGQCFEGECQPCPSDTPFDPETKTCQLPEVEVTPEEQEENLEDLKRDCYEGGGTYDEAAKKCNYEQEADVVNDPCQGLKDEKYDKCSNAKAEPEKPGSCPAEEPKCEGGYQSKEEACAGKEGKDKKACEKEVDKHNKEVNKAYKDEKKAYDKEQKEIAKDKYESRKGDIAPGKEVNCDGLSSSQCSSLQNKQKRADEKQAKKDQKDGIEQRYNDAMKACHGDPDCEKDAKKTKRQETNAMNKQNFNNFMNKTNDLIKESSKRIDNARGMISNGVTAVNNITKGIGNATNAIHDIERGAKAIGSAGSAHEVFSGLQSMVHGTGALASTTGSTIGSVTSNLSSSANNAQDLFSSREQRTQNDYDRSHGNATNAFSGAMDKTSSEAYHTGYSLSETADNASSSLNSADMLAGQYDSAKRGAEEMLGTIDKSANSFK